MGPKRTIWTQYKKHYTMLWELEFGIYYETDLGLWNGAEENNMDACEKHYTVQAKNGSVFCIIDETVKIR